MTLPELHHLATKVRAIGFQDIEVKERPKIGIQTGGYFFPATELDSIVNVGFFVNGMFEAIAARREKRAKPAVPKSAKVRKKMRLLAARPRRGSDGRQGQRSYADRGL